jgi:hypothetical protein
MFRRGEFAGVPMSAPIFRSRNETGRPHRKKLSARSGTRIDPLNQQKEFRT